jgi:CIC family chloride channel protein
MLSPLKTLHVKKSLQSVLSKFIHTSVHEERAYLALTIVTAVITALMAVSLHALTSYLTGLIGSNKAFTWSTYGTGLFLIVLSGYITTRKYPSTAGSGIPGVRVALAVFHGKIRPFATLAKFITSVLSLSSGVSLGREGPTVSIGAGIGSWLGSAFHLSKKRVKALTAVGAAGGLAAAFNTPISAVVFTLEEVVGDLNAKILGSIVIAAVAASVTASLLTGGDATFSTIAFKLGHPRDLLVYLSIGLVCAFVGPLWMKCALWTRKKRIQIFNEHKLTPMIFAFSCIALMSLLHPAVLGGGSKNIEQALLSLILDYKVLALIFLLKFVATSICYASGISGGLFMPTLLMGATLGSLIGTLATTLFPSITYNIGAFALVGMGAYFAAVIRAPFTSILMAFELTRDYNIMLPLMMANIVSYVVSSKFCQGSIYEEISEQDGIHLPTREDDDILDNLTVGEAMTLEVKTLDALSTVEQAMEAIKNDHISGYPLILHHKLVGMISWADLGSEYAQGNFGKKLRDIGEKKIIKIYADQSLMVAFHYLKKYSVSRLPVVSRINDKQIIGIITAENIVSNFGYHISQDDRNHKKSFEDYEEILKQKKKDLSVKTPSS